MTTTPNMSLVLPTEGGSSNVWDVILDTAFGLIDSHDHSTGQGVQVPTAGLNINGDLSFAGFGLTHLKSATFDEQSSTPGNKSIWTSDADHNLYWTNSSGVDVKITDGSTLNVSIVGGIGGDYSSVGALISYDDATQRYLLQQEGSPRPWAGLATADIALYEKAASITNKVTLKSPSALAASYTVTLPPALTSSAAPLQVDQFGVGAFSASFPSTTIFVAGDFKSNGTQALMIHAAMADLGSNARVFGAQGMKMIQLNGGNACTFPCPVLANPTVNGYAVQIIKNSTSATTVHAQLYTVDASGTETARGSGSSDASNAGGAISLTETNLNLGLGSLLGIYIAVWATGGGTSDNVISATFSYKRA